ncbi:MAG TPA: ABC transporter substrate-binding protein [Gammaproteobacteria bacterium]|nr:ABC transporter substrate-binding protein [Gammaproteobacteria bacterium]
MTTLFLSESGFSNTIAKLFILLVLSAGFAHAEKSTVETSAGTLMVVTSYPEEMTSAFRRAFQKQYPDVQVNIVKKKTGAALKYIQSISARNTVDLLWVSSPDAFELLKSKQLLAKYEPVAFGIPDYLGSYPLNDPEGFYTGFAGSGYGMMYNTRYLKSKHLPAPKSWSDLSAGTYSGHIGMSTPSRSGTTHLIIESILQDSGWDKGWGTIKGIAGNLKKVTKKSYDVPVGVRDGEFGVGLVVDYYGLSAKARNYPVDFTYPEMTAILPASVGVIKNAPNQQAAQAFIEFLLSSKSQTMLLHKDVRRLPIRPEVYRSAPANYPNPHKDKALSETLELDVLQSKQRYNLVNSLFDVMVTYNFDELTSAISAVHRAEALIKGDSSAFLKRKIGRAKELISFVPIDEARSKNADFSGLFTKKRKKKTDKVSGRQKNIEDEWDELTKASYKRAKKIADEVYNALHSGV